MKNEKNESTAIEIKIGKEGQRIISQQPKGEVLKLKTILYGRHHQLTVIESPYAGNVRKHEAYARAALKDSLGKGESPLASHLLYTQVLDDTKEDEREKGIKAGFEWLRFAHKQVFYIDYGYSPGMLKAKEEGAALGLEQEERVLLMFCGEYIKTCSFIGFNNVCNKTGACEHKSLTNNQK